MAQQKLSRLFSVFITESNALATQFVSDTRVPLISFTGSTAIGQQVNEIIARRFGKALLELSGNNAIIVDETADLQLAVPAIVFGAIGTAGQRCTTTRRLIVHAPIYDKLIAALINAYKKITMGNPLNKKNLLGLLIDQAAVTNYITTLAAIKQVGGKILFGGQLIKGAGYYVEPTLIEAKNEWEVVQRETFLPILYIMKYKTLEEAIAMQNFSRYGLSSALFTGSPGKCVGTLANKS